MRLIVKPKLILLYSKVFKKGEKGPRLRYYVNGTTYHLYIHCNVFLVKIYL